ncbi:hypothetical protein [Streptomyces sp. AK02-01A]|uniref:hypothetical protein n=1 Tax=Streptomyces sp. AK02-01A TaxID=3028648 RepID=UPI0029A18AA0|nr:hypothetical protein [Streptomyces sp. AK02-01A]MDX3850614.1 hypothetical protein [Streptomyces sp. AK02-01A]
MTRPTGRRMSHAVHTADCIADSAGGITFDIRGAARPDALLVLRRRGGRPGEAGDEVRLPLTGAGESRLRAVLPSTVDLAEGHWDVRTGAAGEEPVRPGVRDVRALIDRVPESGRVFARIPYPTPDGRLAVRSWVRAPHAEAGTVRCDQDTATVEGMLYGSELGEGAEAEARLRGGDRTHRVAVTGRGGAFVFTLPYGPLAAKPVEKRQWWDLWLRPARDAAGIRISRILDDVWDKRAIHVYPGHRADGWLAAPCYTGDNDFCVRLDPAPVSSTTR